MIPQPIVSRFVSRAMSAETTVDDRASIPCLRHQGYASASQIVSKPCSSSARAVASISPTGSIVSCITPMRNAGATKRSSQLRAAGRDGERGADLSQTIGTQSCDAICEEASRHGRNIVEAQDAIARHPVDAPETYLGGNAANRARRRHRDVRVED